MKIRNTIKIYDTDEGYGVQREGKKHIFMFPTLPRALKIAKSMIMQGWADDMTDDAGLEKGGDDE